MATVFNYGYTAQEMKFSIKNFSSKCIQILVTFLCSATTKEKRNPEITITTNFNNLTEQNW